MTDDLAARLAAVLPSGHNFGIYHLSTPPTKTNALFHAPPGQRPDRTFIESHFLGVTITHVPGPKGSIDGDEEVLAFALEIFIFTTAYSSTFFVAKADSSGYLHLLGLPKGTPSPIRAVSSVFLTFLVEQRRRAGVPSIISLFARSQSQYLFPGSVDNPGKHVLDDRGLVKWWCRVLDPLLLAANGTETDAQAKGWKNAQGYLVVPGLDTYETRAFLPRRPDQQKQWTLGHPLESISHYVTNDAPRPPPRCLIPQYPDDPKARYLDELDEEAERTSGKEDKSGGKTTATGQNGGWNGQWKSVKSLDQFWEMMAFRQECSSGRLTGFLWIVFEPEGTASVAAAARQEGAAAASKQTPTKKKKKQALRGYIVSRRPRPKTQQRYALAARPTSTAYYRWPVAGRGRLLVDESDYKRINELLLQLDFSTFEKSAASTRRWVHEAGIGSGDWRVLVVGTQTPVASSNGQDGHSGQSSNGVTDLSNLVKRKRAPSEADTAAEPQTKGTANGAVNVLSAGLVRKKQKHVESTPEEAVPTGAPAVNVLSAGLVRKKPKA
ncbi:hypothetical protein HMPREF1624_02191 [Sporothrix schenckii ATCC 58251]|uniref:histone acetyltransferase n=1 Tax=Sporothrix schenckii (strain ATCC 58251 / de Perez 2211183) TaxID=1391915 RepID=U7Q2N2_SPOS1|nr:hypothetical protein HMPREF1624_02191 [Sporothrix schenckii ATCC 58251]